MKRFAFAQNKNNLWLHVGMWMLYFSFWGFMLSRNTQDFVPPFLFTIILLTMQMVTVYINVYVLIPKFLTTRRYLVYFILLFLLFFMVATIIFYAAGINIRHRMIGDEFANQTQRYFFAVFMTIFSTSLPTLVLILYERLRADNEAKQIEKENVETELKFLRAQINPHFLFNAINSIFNLIEKDPERARSFLVKFSDMLRYQLYETQNNKISLAAELDYIQSYAAMEQLRKGNNLEVKLEFDQMIPFTEVPPMILLSFTENAFKHVSNHYDKKNWVHIALKKENGTLNFSVFNSKDSSQTMLKSEIGGIGLDNIKRRLELLYSDDHELLIKNGKEVFEVDLKLALYKK